MMEAMERWWEEKDLGGERGRPQAHVESKSLAGPYLPLPHRRYGETEAAHWVGVGVPRSGAKTRFTAYGLCNLGQVT